MLGPCFVIHFLCQSRVGIIWIGKRELLFSFNCHSFKNKCSVSLPCGSVGWSAVCDEKDSDQVPQSKAFYQGHQLAYRMIPYMLAKMQIPPNTYPQQMLIQ